MYDGGVAVKGHAVDVNGQAYVLDTWPDREQALRFLQRQWESGLPLVVTDAPGGGLGGAGGLLNVRHVVFVWFETV